MLFADDAQERRSYSDTLTHSVIVGHRVRKRVVLVLILLVPRTAPSYVIPLLYYYCCTVSVGHLGWSSFVFVGSFFLAYFSCPSVSPLGGARKYLVPSHRLESTLSSSCGCEGHPLASPLLYIFHELAEHAVPTTSLRRRFFYAVGCPLMAGWHNSALFRCSRLWRATVNDPGYATGGSPVDRNCHNLAISTRWYDSFPALCSRRRGFAWCPGGVFRRLPEGVTSLWTNKPWYWW